MVVWRRLYGSGGLSQANGLVLPAAVKPEVLANVATNELFEGRSQALCDGADRANGAIEIRGQHGIRTTDGVPHGLAYFLPGRHEQGAKAEYKDGVLNLVLPKKAGGAAKRIAVS